MRQVYLDNASTTPIREEVILAMTEVLRNNFGNPSSTYAIGRSAKVIIETARKQIAKYLNATAQEIIFTATATEANNWILRNAVQHLQVKRIITSKIEHHAVLNTVIELQKEFGIEVSFVNLLENGNIDYTHLGKLLKDLKPTLVSLMHVNNEIGNLLDIHKVAVLCKEHQAYFHSDTVQSMGKISFDLRETPIDFLVATAHKFHGPKGIGFLFSRKRIHLKPLYFGGSQEKGIRPGTESTHQIVGLAKALELSYKHLEAEYNYIKNLRAYLIQKLNDNFSGYKINGDVANSAVHILNIQFPFKSNISATILFSLDMKGIAISRGSACQSGSISQSHVLVELLDQEALNKPSLRISLSHFNTTEDIDLLIKALGEL